MKDETENVTNHPASPAQDRTRSVLTVKVHIHKHTHAHTHTTNRTRMNQTNPRLLMNADVHFPLEKSRQRAPLPGHSLVAYSSARRAKRRWICTPSTANSHSVSCKVVSTEHLIVCDGASCLLFPFFPFQSLWPR